jgi:xanthosine utilization system XapX-like protein
MTQPAPTCFPSWEAVALVSPPSFVRDSEDSMKIRLTILAMVLIPVLVAGGYAVTHKPMTAPVVAILGAVMIWLAYTRYARRIDADVIRPDDKKATPARMYMDGVDFMPTSRNVLYGYHFKSIAAAGPIVGPIAAATLWGWMPALLWLTLGVSFLGWASDYSAIVVAVRNDGNSLSAIAHRLIAPRARIILFVFIFFYLLLLAGAFVGIMAGIFDPRADVPFGIFMLAIMGLLMGQMLYKWKMDLILVTFIAVALTLGGMALGAKGISSAKGTTPDGKPAAAIVFGGPINSQVVRLGNLINRISGREPLYTVVDPTKADPRLATTIITPDGKVVPKYVDQTGAIKIVRLLVPDGVRLLLPGDRIAHLALCPADQLHRLLGDVHHHRAFGAGRHCRRRACPAWQSRDGQGRHLPDQAVHHLDADDAGQGRGRRPPAGRSCHPADLADAVRDHRLRRHLRLARAGRFHRHRAPARI